MALTTLSTVLLAASPEAANTVAEADTFGTPHLIALILMPLLAVVVSGIAGVAVMKAAPDPTVGH